MQSSMQDLNVLVCHHHLLIRLGLLAALRQSRLDADSQVGHPSEAGFEERLHRSDVVVTDYEHGLALSLALQKAVGAPPSTHVLVVSNRDGEHDIRRAIDHGVKGYLLYGCEVDELVDVVCTTGKGLLRLCGTAAHRMVESLSRESLTGREIQVLQCLVDGFVNKDICIALGIALGTVKAHVQAIFSKLDVATRTQAVAVARSRGIVSPSRAGSIEGPPVFIARQRASTRIDAAQANRAMARLAMP